MRTRATLCAILLPVASIVCGCPAALSPSSVIGTWQAVGVVSSPPEYIGMIDSYQIDLFANGQAEVVPGSGTTLGIDPDDMTWIETPDANWVISGSLLQVTASYSFRYEGVTYASSHVFRLSMASPGRLVGTRSTSTWQNGIYTGSAKFDETWTQMEKAILDAIVQGPCAEADDSYFRDPTLPISLPEGVSDSVWALGLASVS